MTRLIADAGEIGEFAKAVFPYASDGAVISLRTFDDGGSDRPLSILPVRLNGVGLEPLIDAAAEQAQFAADHGKKANFCPPIAGFSDLAKADEGHLVEGYTLSVECDQKPQEARQKLEPLFGPATIVVASGGRWLDPDTGELQQKLHLHWRLNEPARDVDLARLKEARKLAATLVGGDLSNVPVTHPIRWAGSWHRKGEPCLARIIAKSANEIGLSDALETLRLVSSETEEKPFEKADGDKKRQDDRPTAALIDNIRTGCEFNPSIVPLAARLIGSGMKPGAVVNFIRELMEEVPANRRDGRWQLRFHCIPQWVATAEAKFGRRADNEEASGTSKKGGLVFTSLDSVQPEPVQWVWERRVARRKLTLVAGDPGIGKSQVGNDIIARTTTGRAWPDGGKAPLGRCLVLSAEDGVADTIRPRLEAAGADLSMVEVLTAVVSDDGKRRSFSLQQDLEALERKVRATDDVVLVKIDPITSYMGSGVDSHRTTDVRAVLEPVATFAERNNVAVLAVTHPPKAAQQKAIHAFTGSLAFAAAARIALLAVEEPETDRRLLLSVKNNIGPEAAGIAYRLEQRTVTNNVVGSHVVWDTEPVTMSANEAMRSAGSGESKVAEAEELLREELADGPVPADEIIAKAARVEISEKTLRRAKKRLGINATKGDFFGGWKWELAA
jgi:hypothetical protein